MTIRFIRFVREICNFEFTKGIRIFYFCNFCNFIRAKESERCYYRVGWMANHLA